MKYKHGLTVGRFNPFHEGHAYLIDRMCEECEKVTVVIGSPKHRRTAKNPFITFERFSMLHNIYKDRIETISIGDINNIEKWAEYILTLVDADAYYAGNAEDGYPFNITPGITFIDCERHIMDLSATKIREYLENEDVARWQIWTPHENWEIIRDGWKKWKQI
jgi:cytidyltransferase-like protein